jgi:hypothetical protein
MNVKLMYKSSTAFTKIVLGIPSTVLACVSLRFAWLGLAVASWTDLRSVQIAHHVEDPGTARRPWSKRRRNNERGNRRTHFKVLNFFASISVTEITQTYPFLCGKTICKLGGLQLRSAEVPCSSISTTWHQSTYPSWQKQVFLTRTHKI